MYAFNVSFKSLDIRLTKRKLVPVRGLVASSTSSAPSGRAYWNDLLVFRGFLLLYSYQRSGDIITCATRMLQFSSEMQQTWHTYYPRPQEQLLLKMFFFKFRP
jgi:hypothetical protein